MALRKIQITYAVRMTGEYYLVSGESLELFDGEKDFVPFPNFSLDELVEHLKIREEDIIQRTSRGMKLRPGVIDKFFEINLTSDVEYGILSRTKNGFERLD